MKNNFEQALKIEDYLQKNDVFVNGLNDCPAHMDSYMTVLSYKRLDELDLFQAFSKPKWEQAIEYWKETELPMSKLISKVIGRKLKDCEVI